MIRLDAQEIAVHRADDVHPPQHRGDDLDVFGARARDFDLAAGHRGDDGPAAGVDVVAPELMRGAVQLPTPVNADR